MGVTIKSRKLLWGKAANRCSIAACRQELVMDGSETDDPSIIGEECHIIAREDEGPRGDLNFSKDQRDLYGNLILMCNIHHKVIDDQTSFYTVEKLKEIKRDHEDWVRNSLDVDETKIKNELIYSTYIDKWAEMADLENWEAWTSWLLGSGQPTISKQKLQDLEQLKDWIFTRIMPQTFIELENAFENFRRVLESLINTFSLYSKERGEWLETEKFYRVERWDPELNSKLHKEYMFHVDLIMDLTVELTRAANYICDQVRRYIMSDFRLKEGLLVVTAGPFMDLSFRTYKIRYTGDQRNGIPYENLNHFKKERQNRDYNFGAGSDVEEALELGIEY